MNLNLLASRGKGRAIKYELYGLVFSSNDHREFMLAGCLIR